MGSVKVLDKYPHEKVIIFEETDDGARVMDLDRLILE